LHATIAELFVSVTRAICLSHEIHSSHWQNQPSIFLCGLLPVFFIGQAQIPLPVKARAGKLVGKTVHNQCVKNENNDQQCCYMKSKILER